MKVDLGCTDSLKGGCDIGVDIIHNAGLAKQKKFRQADLNETWPFKSGKVDYFRAHDIIEHLPDHIHTMNEMWRCLKHGGTVDIVVPLFPYSGSVQDPQHCSFWTERSFKYYEYDDDYRERLKKNYGIAACFITVRSSVSDTVDGKKLSITLKAVKR